MFVLKNGWINETVLLRLMLNRGTRHFHSFAGAAIISYREIESTCRRSSACRVRCEWKCRVAKTAVHSQPQTKSTSIIDFSPTRHHVEKITFTAIRPSRHVPQISAKFDKGNFTLSSARTDTFETLLYRSCPEPRGIFVISIMSYGWLKRSKIKDLCVLYRFNVDNYEWTKWARKTRKRQTSPFRDVKPIKTFRARQTIAVYKVLSMNVLKYVSR